MEEIKLRKREKTRRLIIRTTQRLYSEYGRNNVNMQMVADACGVCRRTVYNHFLSMDILFQAALEFELNQMIDNLGKVLEMNLPADKMLKVFVQTHFENIRQATDRNRALKVSFYETYADIDRARRPIDLKEIRMIKTIIDRGRTQGLFDIRESQWPAMLMLYAIKGIEMPYLKQSIGDWLDKNQDYIMDILFRGLTKREK